MLTSTPLAWQKMDNLLPVVIQHALSGDVLMLGYMDPTALAETQRTGLVTFYSRSQQRLWTKGETSGNTLQVVSINADCDQDALLILANPAGPTCHLGTRSCFSPASSTGSFLYQLEEVIAARKHASSDHSYTAHLYASGRKRIAQKVAEEGVETALAAVAGDPTELVNEAADLLFHLLVLLQEQQIGLNDVITCLHSRHNNE